MSKQITITPEEKEAFDFLNELRLSGVTNMFGASPYLVDEFGYTSAEARTILAKWMENFNEDGYDHLLEGHEKSYEVIWRVDIEATSPEQAAEIARAMQTRPGTTATVFEVTPSGGSLSEMVEVDLDQIDQMAEDVARIVAIIKEHGEFSTMDVEADSSPSIGHLGEVCQLAEFFTEGGATVTTYDGSIELHETEMTYGEIADKNPEAIADILLLAENWEADCLKTEKRISN